MKLHILFIREKEKMKCKDCKSDIKEGYVVGCPNCGLTVCESCRDKTHGICPNCYSTLEYIG